MGAGNKYFTHGMNMNLGKLQKMVRGREAWWAAVQGVSKSWTQLDDWTATNTTARSNSCIIAK